MALEIISLAALKRLGLLFLLLGLLVFAAWFAMLRMPGRALSLGGAGPTARETALATELRADVEALGGERNVQRPERYAAAARAIQARLEAAGYRPARQEWQEGGVTCANLEAERPGSSAIVVVGAHYDSVAGSPGANDNGSGVAAGLALARRFARRPTARALRFVFFANEEPPFFGTERMGSEIYARRCRERGEEVAAMLCLETMGCFSDEPGSQRYPIPFLRHLYGTTGDYISFVGNLSSRGLVHDAIGTFRAHARIRSEGVSMPAFVPGIDWSDQRSFWEQGYPGVMVTDTAPYRYAHYHTERDTPDRIDYVRLARVVEGLEQVVAALAGAEEHP